MVELSEMPENFNATKEVLDLVQPPEVRNSLIAEQAAMEKEVAEAMHKIPRRSKVLAIGLSLGLTAGFVAQQLRAIVDPPSSTVDAMQLPVLGMNLGGIVAYSYEFGLQKGRDALSSFIDSRQKSFNSQVWTKMDTGSRQTAMNLIEQNKVV